MDIPSGLIALDDLGVLKTSAALVGVKSCGVSVTESLRSLCSINCLQNTRAHPLKSDPIFILPQVREKSDCGPQLTNSST